MSDLDRQRAEKLMREAGLDGLLLFQPENLRYVFGAPAGVATMWGRAGAAVALVPLEATTGLAAIAADHAAAAIRRATPDIDIRTHRIWIDVVDLSGAATLADVDAAYGSSPAFRPETFDQATSFSLLSTLLQERGMECARLGADLAFLPEADFQALKRLLPHVQWSDASRLVERLRVIKSPREIERLREAATLAEAGLEEMKTQIRPGTGLPALSAAWKRGVERASVARGARLTGHWDYISVGSDLGDSRAVVTPGAIVKADVGALVDGYSSDGARSFCYGPPSPLASDLFKIMETAFAAGLEALRPGRRFADVHAAMIGSVRRDGLQRYARGHLGHSVGSGLGIEEWPFFSAESEEIIETNMVVALEAPFYGQGLGALMIEDQFLVTETGVECMNRLPRGLIDLSI